MWMMGPFTYLLSALAALSTQAAWASTYQGEQSSYHYSGCWDCNYAPSGFIKGSSDWRYGSTEVGYMRCAMVIKDDPKFLHKNYCKSGRCYIRREENGMVYRGCADYENLPWKVRTDVNCKYQGPGKALWWFCNGDKCNNGQLGETEDICGSPPEQPTYAPEHQTQDLNSTSYEKGPHDHNHYGHNQYGAHVVSLSLVPRGHPADPVYRQDYQEQEVGYGHAENDVDQYGEYNPCDGKVCHENHSGLFKDPNRPSHFIQCGCGNDYGRPCTCCKPFYLSCGRNRVFDDVTKVCVGRENH